MNCHAITITEGPLANSDRPQPNMPPMRKGSDLGIDSPVKLQTHREFSCRICLEQCEPVHYCLCTGGMLCHHECLREYLDKKYQRSAAEESACLLACEVCRHPYALTTTNSILCSRRHLAARLSSSPCKCFLYSVFFLVAICVNGYLLHKLIRHELKPDLMTVAVAVLASLLVMFVFLLVLWVFEFTLVRRVAVLAVKEVAQEDIVRGRKNSRAPILGKLEESMDAMVV